MKFCEPHWSKLREAVDAAGLGAFVAKSGEAVAARLASELTTGPTPSNFDPLMGAHNAIVANVLKAAGLVVMFPKPDGTDHCPLCYVLENCPCPDKGTAKCTFASWIDRAVADQVAHAKELGS